MAKELPRIAKSSEETAFATEENYFVLEKISSSIKNMASTLNLVFMNSIVDDLAQRQEIDATLAVSAKLDGLTNMLGEFIETMKRQMLRDMDKDQPPSVAPTDEKKEDGDKAPRKGSMLAIFGGLGFIGKGLAMALGALVGGVKAWIKTLQFYSKLIFKVDLAKAFANAVTRIRNIFTSVKNFLGSIANAIKPVTNMFKSAMKSVGTFSSLIRRTSSFLGGIAKSFSSITKLIAPFGKIFS